jgi:predicted heme/steroid binding protein
VVLTQCGISRGCVPRDSRVCASPRRVMQMTRRVTPAELAQHTSPIGGAWIALHGAVYDVTPFLDQHPGGRKILLDSCGGDATQLFDAFHPQAQQVLEAVAAGLKIGEAAAADDAEPEKSPSPPSSATASGVPANFLSAMDSGAFAGRTQRNLQARSVVQTADRDDASGKSDGSYVSVGTSLEVSDLQLLKNLHEFEREAYRRASSCMSPCCLCLPATCCSLTRKNSVVGRFQTDVGGAVVVQVCRARCG